MLRRLAESALFFREYIRHFHTTGAVLPSGRFLAAELTRFVGNQKTGKGDRSNLPEQPEGCRAQIGPVPFSQPLKILEVGPGTGAVTGRIVGGMGTDDKLDLVELNESFVRKLEHRFQTEPAFQSVADRARIHHCPIEELPGDESYNVIVSGLPLNNFAVADVERILAVLTDRLVPGGMLSFFEYIAVRPARAMLSGRAERERLRAIGQTMRSVLQQHELRRDAVWLNVPPAWVHHLRK